jgi:ATP-dependent Clp protease ATP-binding subunit ClpA
VCERFTDRARYLVVLAQEEARWLNHNYIGTEHILLGLIHEADGVAAKALESLSISLEAVRRQVEEIVGQGEAAPTGHIPFTSRAKKVLEQSFREALQLGHSYIGTEHLLLGLIREGQGVAAQVLQKLGADLDRVRQAVIQQLSESAAGTPEEILATLPREFHRGKPKSPFTKREWIVLSLLIEGGLTTSEIAELLGVPEEAVGEIVKAVIEKLKHVGE